MCGVGGFHYPGKCLKTILLLPPLVRPLVLWHNDGVTEWHGFVTRTWVWGGLRYNYSISLRGRNLQSPTRLVFNVVRLTSTSGLVEVNWTLWGIPNRSGIGVCLSSQRDPTFGLSGFCSCVLFYTVRDHEKLYVTDFILSYYKSLSVVCRRGSPSHFLQTK